MIIVTGGAGFIGSAFVDKLNQEGIDDILIVDNLASSEKWKNLNGRRFTDYIHKSAFPAILHDGKLDGTVEFIIHLGACSATTERNADYLIENNYHYSRELAEWAMKNEVRFLYASSAATYGDGSLGFSDGDETTLKLLPQNAYGYSKQLMDLWALRTGAIHSLVGLKFFNVFGPNEYHKADMRSVVVKAYQEIEDTGSVRLFKSYRKEYKDGEQQRDFVYIKDVVNIIWWLMNRPEVNGIFNVGTGQPRSWLDLARAVFMAMDKTPEIEFIDMPEPIRDRYQYYTCADMSRLQKTGCPFRFTSLKDAIRDYVVNYLESGKLYL
jgi:ADP-L-glycero-D-manno-heptose 6-epimerase